MSIRTASMALVAGLTLAAPISAYAAPTVAVTHVEKSTTAPAPAPQEDASSYADREASNQKVANYEGGSTVVIAMSGGAFVVLLLLLLLL